MVFFWRDGLTYVAAPKQVQAPTPCSYPHSKARRRLGAGCANTKISPFSCGRVELEQVTEHGAACAQQGHA